MTKDLLIKNRFDDVVNKDPLRIAIQVKKGRQWQRWTYAQVREEALRVAAFLQQENPSHDCVALALETRPEWIFIYLGIMYAGMTCVPIDTQLGGHELARCILDCHAVILFCSKEIYENRLEASLWPRLKRLVVLDAEDLAHEAAVGFPDIGGPSFASHGGDQNEDRIASLIYTSGTTDVPKAVLLTHKNFCSNFISIDQLHLCSSDDNFFAFLPLHHTYPFMATVILPLFLGARITCCPQGFNPSNLAALVNEGKVSVLVGVPQVFALMYHGINKKISSLPLVLRVLLRPFMRHKIHSQFGRRLRLMVSGGARLDPKMAQGLAAYGFKIVEGYGLTETSPVATFNPLEKVKYGSVGKAIPGVQIRIDEPNPSGIGQVLIKGPNVMKGYYNQPQVTGEVIKDAWFHSGDLGYIDEDGYLFLTGRSKEVIVLGSGKNIYPEELEARFLKSPFIKEICIIDKKDERFGQEVESLFAVVVPDLDHFQRVREKNIQRKIRWEVENLSKDLPAYQHIMGFTLTKDELPKTSLKKLKRYEVKAKYLNKDKMQTLEVAEPLSKGQMGSLDPHVVEKILAYLTEQIHLPIALEQHLEIDLGIDSLTRVELALGIEKMFKVKIPDEDFYSISTVRDLIFKVDQLSQDKRRGEGEDARIQGISWAQILKTPPSSELLSKIKLTITPWDWIFTAFFKGFFWLVCTICWLLRIRKKQPLSAQGPYILCPNHASYLDAFFVFCGLPLRSALNTYFVGLSAILEHPWVRWAQRIARLVPIDSNANFAETMQTVAYLLSQNKIVCIFPEGQRSVDGEIKEFKKGIGILLKELDIQVVPVHILGSYFAWPRTKKWPRPYPVRVAFGTSFSSNSIILEKKPSADEEYAVLASFLRQKVCELEF